MQASEGADTQPAAATGEPARGSSIGSGAPLPAPDEAPDKSPKRRSRIPRPWGGFGTPGSGQRPGTRNPLLSSREPHRRGLIAGYRIDPGTLRVERIDSPPAPSGTATTKRPTTTSGHPTDDSDAAASGPTAAAALPHQPGAATAQPWVWLHFDHNNPLAHRWIREESGIPGDAANGLLAEVTRPRTVESDGGILFIARGINLNPDADPTDMVSLRAWVEHGRLVTVILRPVQSVVEVSDLLEAAASSSTAAAATTPADTKPLGSGDATIDHAGPPTGDPGPAAAAGAPAPAAGGSTASLFHGPIDLLHQIVHRMIDKMVPLVQAMNDRLEDLVAGVIDESVVVTASELAPIRLQLITLHRYLAPLREALIALSQLDRRWMLPSLRAKFRDVADRVMRLTEELAAAQNRAAVARDEIVSQGSERLNRRVFSLTVLTAIFLPLTVLTGMLGMNVAGIPGSEHPLAFLIVSGILGGVLALQLLILRWLKWF